MISHVTDRSRTRPLPVGWYEDEEHLVGGGSRFLSQGEQRVHADANKANRNHIGPSYLQRCYFYYFGEKVQYAASYSAETTHACQVCADHHNCQYNRDLHHDRKMVRCSAALTLGCVGILSVSSNVLAVHSINSGYSFALQIVDWLSSLLSGAASWRRATTVDNHYSSGEKEGERRGNQRGCSAARAEGKR